MDNNNIFVSMLTPLAIKYGATVDILPSVIITNAILESSWGTSGLYGTCNNIYNLKVDENWMGKCYSKESKKTYKTPKDSNERVDLFKVYNNIEESVSDYVSYLTESRRSNNGPLLYENIIGTKSYKDAFNNLYNRDDYPKRRGINYSSIVYYNMAIEIVDKYELFKIDDNIDQYIKEYNMAINRKPNKNNTGTTKYEHKEVTPPVLYRVRLTWEDQDSQILVSKDKGQAIKEAESHPGYKVFVGDDGEIVFDQEVEHTTTDKNVHYHPGKAIVLNNCPLYRNYLDKVPLIRLNGTFYMYNSHINNGRIRISKCNDITKLNGKDINAILGCIDVANI